MMTYGGFQQDAVFEMRFHVLVEVRVFLAAPVQIMTSYSCLERKIFPLFGSLFNLTLMIPTLPRKGVVLSQFLKVCSLAPC